jgi:hypothetical protein
MTKPTLLGQLSWPVPVDFWKNCRAQFEWTKALTDLSDHYEVILIGTNPEQKEFETEKDGCRLVFTKPENHGRWIQALKPDVIFWNDFPPIFRDWMPGLQSSRHIMRMHGDWRMFHGCWDVLRQAWKVVVPMVGDPIVCKAFGVNSTVRIKFGVDVPEMQGGKQWAEREIHFASPARDVPKGSEVMESVFSVLRKMGYRCESNCWLPRDQHRDMIQNTKIFWVPSAHECISRTATEASVAGCHLVACSESAPMVEQVGLQGGSVVSTDLLYDIPNRKWTHRRDPKLIAKDLEKLVTKPPSLREDWSDWDVSREVELLRELFIEAKP